MKNTILKIKKELYEEYIGNKAFWSTVVLTFILGYLIHFFYLANHLFNHDSLSNIYTNSDGLVTQGKWFVTPLTSWQGPIALQYLRNAVGIVFVSLSAGVLGVIFRIKSKKTVILLAGIYASFPSIATVLMYSALDYFAAASFFAILAAYFMIKKSKIYNLLGIVLLTLSLGAYQAYISFTASILVLVCGIKLLEKESKVISVVKQGIFYIGELLISLGLYYLILQVILQTTGNTLGGYKGISDAAGNLSPMVLLSSTVVAFLHVGYFVVLDGLGKHSVFVALFLILTVACVYIMLFTIIGKRKIYNKLSKVVWLFLIFGLFFPLSVNLIGVLSANTSFYYITVHSIVMLFVCAPILMEKLEKEEGEFRHKKCLIVLTLGAIFMCIVNWTIQNNQVYEKYFIANENIEHKVDIMISQIQSNDKFTIETPVVFIGNRPYQFLKSQGAGLDFEQVYIRSIYLQKPEELVANTDVLKTYIKNFVAPNMTFGDSVTFTKANKEQIMDMEVYPNQGAIEYIDGHIVVKLGEVK